MTNLEVLKITALFHSVWGGRPMMPQITTSASGADFNTYLIKRYVMLRVVGVVPT